MDGVRFLAGIFLWIGWATLVIGALSGFSTLSQVGQSFRRDDGLVNLGVAITPLVTTALLSLAPFFCWAVLKSLCEIYDRIAAQDRQTAPRTGTTPPADHLSYWEDRARKLQKLEGPLL